MVNLKTEKAISGVLWAQRGQLLVLKTPFLLEAGRDPQKVDGEVIIERQNVDFIQILPEV